MPPRLGGQECNAGAIDNHFDRMDATLATID
jgi:hypothetical protein